MKIIYISLSLLKSVLLIVFLFLGIFHLSGQVPKLLGAHSNGTANVFSSINAVGGSYQQINSLNGTSIINSGESVLDEKNNRYFLKTGSKIFVINSITGTVSDSIINIAAFHNIEFDRGSNSVVGMSLTGTSVVFKAYDLNTKIGSVKSTLISVDSITIGESTFDPVRRKYFSMTNLGMVVIDSNGVLVDVLCASPNLFGIEYDQPSNKVFYLEWNGGNYDFRAVDAISCTLEIIGNLTNLTSIANGETTFDNTQGHYYTKTNVGILQIDISNGAVLQTLPASNNFSGIEYSGSSATGLSQRIKLANCQVFPNPAQDFINIVNLPAGANLKIFNSSGTPVYQNASASKTLSVDLSEEPAGVYFYTIYHHGKFMQSGKVMLK